MLKQETRSKQIVKNSSIISALNILGFATALVIDVIVAARFGLQQETDAFFIAFAIPQFLMAVFLVAFNVVLVPLFTQIITENEISKLWKTSSSLTNISLFVLALVSIAGSLLSPFLMRVLGAGLDEATRELAVSLSRIVFFMVMPLGAIEVFKSLLNAKKSFAIPAFSPFIRNIAIAIIAYLTTPIYGIYSLAIAYVLGTWLQFIFLFVSLLVAGFKYHFMWQLQDANIIKAMKSLRHPLLGSGLIQSSMIFERFFVSFLPAGLVTALVFARRIMRAVDVVFTGSITTVLLPDMSVNVNRNELETHKKLLILGTKLTLIISIPVTIGIVGLNEPLVKLLFQRGAFSQEATTITATLLSIYILSIPVKGVLQVFITSFYSANDTRTPFNILTVMLIITIVFQAALFFALGANGLALAETISRILSLGYASYILQQRMKLAQKPLVLFTAKVLIAAVVMLVGLETIRTVMSKGSFGNLGLNVFAQIAIGGLLGMIFYTASLYFLRVQEFLDLLHNRLSSKMG